MKELKGIWWTLNGQPVPGTLVITNEGKILLTTYSRLNEANIINGFAEHKRITLVDIEIERTQIYHEAAEENSKNDITMEACEEITYYTYTYKAQLCIFGHNYKQKGSIRIDSMQLKYTGLAEWVDWNIKMPVIKSDRENITFKVNNIPETKAKLDPFDIYVKKAYILSRDIQDLQIKSETVITIDNIQNKYINSMEGIINCVQSFLVLCTGENVNVEEIKAVDFYGRNIELILGYGKINYENTSILKNIIKFKDIENNFQTIFENWIRLYVDNELLITNFVNLQRREEPLISEYTNLMSAIDSLYLVVTKKDKTKDAFAEILKKLLRETNFILNLSESEIDELANIVKEIRRYFVHSNKTQRDLVYENIPTVIDIVIFLVEVIRARIMLEIGIDRNPIEEYYLGIKQMQKLKLKVVMDENEGEKINTQINKEDNQMKKLSKEDKDNIAQLNAIMGTRHREENYDIENSKDLIELVINKTAEYMDYINYVGRIDWIAECFDQSLEVFHPEKWIGITKDGTTKDEIMDETISNLKQAAISMECLADFAEEECREVWNIVMLGKNNEVREYFLGDVSAYTNEQLLKALDETIYDIYQVDYENQVKTDAENFAKAVKTYLIEQSKQEKDI